MLKDKSRKPSSKGKSTEAKELQTLTIAELDAIAGSGLEIGGLSLNHNETIQKPKPLSEKKPAKVRELQTLTITELDAIAGGRGEWNHNETIVSLS